MMAKLLKASDLPREQFQDLMVQLAKLATPDLTYRIWLEAPDGWAFDWWRGLDQELDWCGAGREPTRVMARDGLARAFAGRLFAPTGELRWRVIPHLEPCCWRTLFLGCTDWVGETLQDHSHCLQSLHMSQQRLFLWGQQQRLFLWGQQQEHTSEEWIELRIPHRFRYPIQDKDINKAQRVRMLVEQWHDDSGEPHFVRWCDLEAYPEKT